MVFLAVVAGLTAGCPSVCSATCDGCCTASGLCQTVSASQSDTQCGRNGARCVNCAASGSSCSVEALCQAPVPPSDGGTSCSSGTCAGCCSGTTTNSVCVTAPSATNCGAKGSVCISCAVGEACVEGACKKQSDAGLVQRIGDACRGDADCEGLGDGVVCRRKTSTGSATYTSGYCTKVCADETECPVGSSCIDLQPGYGETESLCLRRCSVAPGDGCRSPGYACYSLGPGLAACWLSPLPPLDAGPPADRIGSGCMTHADCRNPPVDGVCFPDTLPDGGLSSFVGGYCSAPCTDSAHCASDGGARCFEFVQAGKMATSCLQACSTPGTGRGECRSGYVCLPLRLADGGVDPVGWCGPACGNPNVKCAGSTLCKSNGYCQ